jgi:diguanylate cyclase
MVTKENAQRMAIIRNKAEPKKEPKTMEYARAALPLMAKHGVEPTPQNYAVWYTYACNENKHLNEEINSYIQENRPFTDELNDYFYHRYIAEDIDRKAVEQATKEAHVLMEHVIVLIDAIGGGASEYNEGVQGYVQSLETEVQNSQLRKDLELIIEKTKGLQRRSTKLSSRLEESSSEVKSLQRDLEKVMLESERDFLTGVDNRKAFDEKFAKLFAGAQKAGEDLALLMVDIDHFKHFNDKYGHQVGDDVLKEVARALKENVKGHDVVARYGGEEFAIILPKTPLVGGLTVAENLRKLLMEKKYRKRETKEELPPITISVGVASLQKKSDRLQKMIERADNALYRSKRGGRNKVTQESI